MTESNRGGTAFRHSSKIFKFSRTLIAFALLLCTRPMISPAQEPRESQLAVKLLVKVVDETRVGVDDAGRILLAIAAETVVRGESDAAGRHEFTVSDPGSYQLMSE